MKFRFIVIFVLLSLLLGGVAGSYIAISKGVPSINELKQFNRGAGTKIYADDDVLIG